MSLSLKCPKCGWPQIVVEATENGTKAEAFVRVSTLENCDPPYDEFAFTRNPPVKALQTGAYAWNWSCTAYCGSDACDWSGPANVTIEKGVMG